MLLFRIMDFNKVKIMASEKENHYLNGKLLLAMPSIGDPRFNKAVIFLCAHDERGAMGLVINNRLPGLEFTAMLEQIGIISDIKVDLEKLSLPIMGGGPVEGARGFMLHSNEFSDSDTIKVDDHYGVTGTVDALKKVVEGQGPDDMLFILGYAGWEAGQLDAEIQDNAWLVVDADHDLVFNTQPEEKWQLAVQKLGFDPAMLSAQSGRA